MARIARIRRDLSVHPYLRIRADRADQTINPFPPVHPPRRPNGSIRAIRANSPFPFPKTPEWFQSARSARNTSHAGPWKEGSHLYAAELFDENQTMLASALHTYRGAMFRVLGCKVPGPRRPFERLSNLLHLKA